ncbi:MAG: Wadjet anti-phage system protein JetD domain-containing protein [Clostridium sp.]
MDLFSIFNKKTVSLDDLEKNFMKGSYEDFYNLINRFVNEGRLVPVKSSGGNGKKPTLYKKYKIVVQEESYEEFLDELNFRLSTRFNLDYYRKNLNKYKEHREYILSLSQFFKTKAELLNVEISMNERSFQIFKREKFIQKELGKTILKNLCIDLKTLNYYETSEPIAYFSVHKNEGQNILLIENKDTYYTLRRHLLNGYTEILGVKIHTVMYGAGKSVNKAFKDFNISVEEYLISKENKILYFGDLDYEGILIYESFYSSYNEKYSIEPFLEGYEKMLLKGKGIDLPLSKEGQNKNIKSLFLEHFSVDYKNEIEELLRSGTYIPQEILNITDI